MAVVAGCGAPENAEELGAANRDIVNGIALNQGELNYYGLVAVYHPDGDGLQQFFPRPCSGTIIHSLNGSTIVLTARHCVTTNGEIDGPVALPSAFRLIATLNPGPANPNPPAGTVTPYQVRAMPIDSPDPQDSAQDLALLFVNVDWSAHASARLGMWVGGATRSYPGVDTSVGYGINVADWGCGTDRSIVGSGVARRGGVFTRNTTFSDATSLSWYSINNQPSSGGQTLICGDSGGPDYVNMEFDDDASMDTLVGVHSRADASSAWTTGPSFWLQNVLGGLNLGPLGSTSRLSRALNSHTVTLSASSITGWIYNWSTQQIYDPSQEDVDEDWCLDLSGSTLVANICNSTRTSQKWFPDATLRLRNGSTTGKCLQAPTSGSTVSVATCADLPTRQGWYFHGQP